MNNRIDSRGRLGPHHINCESLQARHIRSVYEIRRHEKPVQGCLVTFQNNRPLPRQVNGLVAILVTKCRDGGIVDGKCQRHRGGLCGSGVQNRGHNGRLDRWYVQDLEDRIDRLDIDIP